MPNAIAKSYPCDKLDIVQGGPRVIMLIIHVSIHETKPKTVWLICINPQQHLLNEQTSMLLLPHSVEGACCGLLLR